MDYSLRYYNQLIQRPGNRLFKLVLLLTPILWSAQTRAQLSTEPLTVTAVCSGAQLDVTGFRSGTADSYGIELSGDGATYFEVPSTVVSTSGRYEITYRATIPANTAPGASYRVRFISTGPDVKGSPSSSLLTVKARPVPPTVNDIQPDCQRRTANDIYTYIYLGINAGATASLYNSNLSLNTGGSFNGSNPVNSYFSLGKPVANGDDGYKYPISETTYFVTQTVNGCESSTAQTIVRTLYTPSGGPNPVNRFNENYGRLSYCQGDKSYPLNVNGHSAPPENYQTGYTLQGASPAFTTTPPIPDTSVPGSQTYKLSLVPVDSKKGCPSPANPNGPYLVVTVNARPGKPATPASSLTLCQSQSVTPLTATTTVVGASLVWYGTSATGGTGTSTPVQPATDKVGTLKYYVAQKLGECESERTEITVDVKPAPAMPDVQSVAVCQNTAAPIIKVTGDNLLWYAASTGGTGSPTTPVVSTSQTSQITYYVSQSVNGCESPRAMFTVTVNALPGAPTVASVKPIYCQNATASPLMAMGQDLKWYREVSGGASLGSTLTPDTKNVGATTYYVSQSSNGCEGPRNGLTVTVVALPSAPTVTSSFSYCQKASSTTLTASGTSLKWYDPSGKSSDMAPIPSTEVPGTVSYFVTQSINGCESPQAEIKVTTKVTPDVPGVQSVAVCQNATAPALTATGQNLLWYSTETSGTGTTAPPIVSTGQSGQPAFYVSQSLDGCESPRARLTVTVNATPGVPVVANVGPTYCQNTVASPLMATGQDLKWYRESSGGTSLGSTVTPDTRTASATTYYVSQSNNGCEGPRSSVTVTVAAPPSAPGVTGAFSYCQRTPAPVLTASGTGLKWYDPSGKSSDVAPTPSTDTPGTVSYFVTQSTSGCESSRAEIKITTKTTPDAPGTSALAVCQNTAATTLVANGQNLLWYTAQTGGTGNAAAPVISTGQASQTTYYVSQSLDGCEGPRAPLSVTVKSLPAAPTVSPKVICQFAPPELLSATGENLSWYNVDGNRFGSAPVIGTDKGASFSVLVSQTVNGCEGPKATQSVTVAETPMPTIAKAVIEICQDAASQPLSATGTSLKWTDPTGKVTTVAPTPATLNVTKNPDGDLFYVTQTVNGCESPKAVIRVFVQSPPTLSILGTTTTNLGLDVPLKLTFTGVGPYTYKLTNGLTGTTTKDTTLLIVADRTTTYQVVDVANKCGSGLPGNGSSVTITVLVPTIQTQALTSATLCAGSSLTTNFTTSGTFNQGSVFKLQLAKVEADTTKIAFADLPGGQAGNGQVSGTIPVNTPAGTYWVRVLATNPKIPIKGTNSPTLLTVRPLPVATLVGSQTIFEGQPASLTVVFSGDGPWTFSYRDSSATGLGAAQSVTTAVSPYALDVRPTKTTAYLLSQVSNGCGTGTLAARSVVVTVNQLLGIEDQSLAEAVDVYPTPATSALTVRIRGLSSSQTAILELTDLAGHITYRQETRQSTTSLLLDQHPAGTYILRIRVGDKTASRRVMKL
ncbi:T9SS type A sorting domain-containing protein [Spirosoma spitsbergense]|uniref:Ig-like domain-containing protein n=1 Tax=Spirosoma spitsbergense TaxID=431554 RepID=UPI00036B5FEC|nr:T9SS type A sorting domain-containing protein [Spirosoma spitsbergense]